MAEKGMLGTDLCEKVPFRFLPRAESIGATVDPRSFSLDRQGQAGSGNGGPGPWYQPLSIRSQERPKNVGDGWGSTHVPWVTSATIG